MRASRFAPLTLLASLASLAALVALVAAALVAIFVYPAYAQEGSAPDKPTGLSATATHGQVVLTWDDPGDDSIIGYVILRRNRVTDAEGHFDELVADTGSSATTYTDAGVAAETRYTYRIKAINEYGVSEHSRWHHIDTPRSPEPSANSPATGEPTISGTAQVGETLTADTSSIADADGLDDVSFTYQWLADDSEIAGATNATYILAADDEGKTIKVRVPFSDDAGNAESLTSAATETVSAAPTPDNSPATGAPTISGTAQVGETLTANTSGSADADGLDDTTFTYQWLADDAEIEGATNATYILAADDEGKATKVQVSFTDDAGNAESLTSAATETVSAAEAGRSPDKPGDLTGGGTGDSGRGTVYTYEDGDRTIRVILQGDLVVQETGADTPSDAVERRADGGNIVRRKFGQGGADLPVFRSASGGALMTLPGGVLLVLDPEWDEAGVNGFFARNNISKARISELDYIPNGFFVRTEPGFPSLELANALAAQQGVLVSSPNWWREVEAKQDPEETKGDDRGATKEVRPIETRNADFRDDQRFSWPTGPGRFDCSSFATDYREGN